MKNFEGLVDEAARAIQRTDSTFRPIIEDSVRRRYKQVLRALGWESKVSRLDITLAADSNIIAVPEIAKEVSAVYDVTNSRTVPARGIEQLYRDYGDGQNETSGSLVYAHERTSAWNGVSFGALNNFIAIFSTAAGDAISVDIKLLDYFGHVYEGTGTVNGVNFVTLPDLPVASLISEVVSFSKSGETAGTIKLAHNTSSNVVSEIGPTQRNARYIWLRLSRAATSGTVFRILYRRNMPEFDAPLDVPAIDCGDVLVVGAIADGLRTMNASQRSLIEEQRFAVMLDDMIAESELEGGDYTQASGSMNEYRVM